MHNETSFLSPAVMTSSSERSLSELVQELAAISGVKHIDLSIGRQADLRAAGIDVSSLSRMTDILADPDLLKRLESNVLASIGNSDISVTALASYLPDISAFDSRRRAPAIQALIHLIQLAIRLWNGGAGKMTYPIIEIVCGSVIEPSSAGPDFRDIYAAKDKIDRLCASLTEVIDRMYELEVNPSFALALEMEPGESYVLNGTKGSISRLELVAEGISKTTRLQKHVGFNIDIAHYRIERIPAEKLRHWLPRIVHAHISDHPRMHTHDQVVGNWTTVESPDRRFPTGGYQEYLQLLTERARRRRDPSEQEHHVLPFSHAIAIELEGCNRIFAIHDSVSRLRQAITYVENRSTL
jgi:sugar phosphate isomerase/epimerase